MIRKLWKSSRLSKALILGAALVILLVFSVALMSLASPGAASSASCSGADREAGFSLAVPSAQRVAGFVETYAPRVEETEKDLEKLSQALKVADERQKKQEELLRALAGELTQTRKDLARAEASRDPVIPGREGDAKGPFPNPLAIGQKAHEDAPEPPSRIQKIRLAGPRTDAAREVHLPAGSFAEGVLLTGCFAPVEGQALPVKIRLTGEWIAPNRTRIPLGDAFLIGKALGDANSERAVVQLDKLSYVHSNGRSIEVSVNGYIADSDGVQGAAGQYVWRAAELVGYSAVAGGISGAGEALAQSQTSTQLNPLGGANQIVTGDLAKFAAGRGTSRAADEIQKAIAKRIDQLIPAIWVPNGRKITVTLIDGATLPGVAPKELDHVHSRTPYQGLDLDR